MKNITCINNWRNVSCCEGATDEFVHGIQILNGEKIIHEFVYPFKVHLTKGSIHFIKDGIESVVAISEVEETRKQIKAIIRTCASGSAIERREVKIVVDTVPVTEIDLPLVGNETHAGIYDVFIPQYVNEGSAPNEYTVLPNGNVEMNTEIPVEIDPYVVTVVYWVNV